MTAQAKSQVERLVLQVTENAELRVYDMAKQQDAAMHNLSGELGVKTSLYLVFTAFVLSASIQIVTFAKDLPAQSGRHAVIFSALGAAVALFAGIALLVAAFVRTYKIFPAQDMANWLEDIKNYATKYPEAQIDDPARGVLRTVIQTVDANQRENEKKAQWIKIGAFFLFASLPLFAIGGALAIRAYLIHPF